MADNENMINEEIEEFEQDQPSKTALEPKKSGKPAKKANKKPGALARIGKWFRELRAEAKKVIWPNKKQIVNNTAVVIVMVIVVAIFVAALDTAFGFVRDFLAQIAALL